MQVDPGAARLEEVIRRPAAAAEEAVCSVGFAPDTADLLEVPLVGLGVAEDLQEDRPADHGVVEDHRVEVTPPITFRAEAAVDLPEEVVEAELVPSVV